MGQIYNSLYPCFQHWTWEGNIRIISDTHFMDQDMEWRGMKAYQIANKISKSCHKGDTLIILGDVGDPSFMSIVKCGIRKILIKGNHDVGDKKYFSYFDEIYDGPLMISPKIMLSHEPCLSPYWFNIHGHDHRNPGYLDNHEANVCCEGMDYTPLNLKDLISSGILKRIDNIHRVTINKAIEKGKIKE